MQYVLLVWVVGVFAAVFVMLRRYQRRTTRLLPIGATGRAPSLMTFGGRGCVWASPSGSGNAAGTAIAVTLYSWGVRFGGASRLASLAVPTVESTYAELSADAVRSKLRSKGVRLRSTAEPQRWVILWTSRWPQVLDALATDGVPVNRQLRALDWSFQ
jgi:hypothetical protein